MLIKFTTSALHFINTHKTLCTLTLAAVIYAFGKFAGRVVSWIGECCGTTKKAHVVGLARLPSFVEAASASRTKIGINESFAAFIEKLEGQIFPLYEAHERGFDKPRIHGRMHIARAVIFGEVMAKHFQEKGVAVDLDYVRWTIGLHDAGREGNGIDEWEEQSSALLYRHLVLKNIPPEEALRKSQIIVKEKADKSFVEFTIFQSADCLDIMRVCTGCGGRRSFEPRYLTFLKDSGPDDSLFRERLIAEAWFFIQKTEETKMTHFNESKGFMQKLFQVIMMHKDRLPILSSILSSV